MRYIVTKARQTRRIYNQFVLRTAGKIPRNEEVILALVNNTLPTLAQHQPHAPRSGPLKPPELAAGSWLRVGGAERLNRGIDRQKGRVPPRTGALIHSTAAEK